jgi:hypothetical protein
MRDDTSSHIFGGEQLSQNSVLRAHTGVLPSRSVLEDDPELPESFLPVQDLATRAATSWIGCMPQVVPGYGFESLDQSRISVRAGCLATSSRTG